MNRRCSPATVLLLCVAAPAGADITVRQVDQAAQAVAGQVVAWRRDFHQHPELGNREFRTSGKVAEHLKALGLEVRTGIAHTGVVGVLRGGQPGPVVALRADMDALPVTEEVDLPFKSTVTAEYRGEKVGVMHACGHDGHTAILMGAAQALAGLRAELPGTVLFVFQPAEEGAPDGEQGGAPLMLQEGLFDVVKPEVVFGLHLWAQERVGDIAFRSGPMLAASDHYRIVVTGRQTHGAAPWRGVDPIVVASQIVLGLQTIVSRQTDLTQGPAVLSVGAIRGGIRFNIIPDSVEMVGTIRTLDMGARKEILDRLARTARDIASSAGATAEIEIATDNNPVLVNDPELAARMRPTLERVAATGRVRETPFVTVAEDFSFYAERVPSLYFFVGSTPAGQDPATAPLNHTPRFPVDESSLQTGVKALVGLTVDYLQGAGR